MITGHWRNTASTARRSSPSSRRSERVSTAPGVRSSSAAEGRALTPLATPRRQTTSRPGRPQRALRAQDAPGRHPGRAGHPGDRGGEPTRRRRPSRPARDVGVGTPGLPRPLARPLLVDLPLMLALVARLPLPFLVGVQVMLERLADRVEVADGAPKQRRTSTLERREAAAVGVRECSRPGGFRERLCEREQALMQRLQVAVHVLYGPGDLRVDLVGNLAR